MNDKELANPKYEAITPQPESPPSTKRRSAAKSKHGKRSRASAKDEAKRGGGPRPFPAETLEEALRVPTALKQFNAGNPWTPVEVANALGVSPRGDKM